MMAKSGLPPGGAASGTELDRGPAAAVTSPPSVHHSGSASALTIGEAAAQLTLDDAVRVARSIQRDLDAGRLKVPYPEKVRVSLRVCLSVFMREGDTTVKAGAIIDRLNAETDPTDTVVPAWG